MEAVSRDAISCFYAYVMGNAMWIVRAIVGLIFLAIAIAAVPLWFERPSTVLVTITFSVLGLWTMGYISRFAPKKALEEHKRQEQEIRQSKHFGLRNRIMGAIALLLGSIILVNAQQSNWHVGWKPLAGGVVFVFFGAWYLLKGRNAE
jgi:putative Mn2+ efflux pump MntP